MTANIRDWLDVTVGTAIPLTLPDGQTISLTVAGFNDAEFCIKRDKF